MFGWSNLIAIETHRRELMHEAELDRLARQAQPKPPKRPDRLDGSLLWMKHQLANRRQSQCAC